MTLPASGPISFTNINTEIGQAPTYSSNLNFLNGLIVSAQRPASPNLSSFYSKAYFQNNTVGACNNGNCSTNCNCACDYNCVNCVDCSAINCANCDSQSWLQTNCNCACTYNCSVSSVPYNCANCSDCSNCGNCGG